MSKRLRRIFLQAAAASALGLILAWPAPGFAAPSLSSSLADGKARLTVLYDNTTARDGVTSDWGFACLIEGMGKTILFDAGARPGLLMENCKTLNVDLGKVDVIVVSHLHTDHAGGLQGVLDKHPAVTLYVPTAVKLPRPETKIIEAAGPIEICPGVRLTGRIVGTARSTPEVGLLLETKAGGMLVTGCAHPGIVDMVRRTAALRGKPVEAVVGGFHLLDLAEADVRKIISDMKAAGVVRCGATHCTGDAAIAQFRSAFGTQFIPLGVGRVIAF